MALQQQPPPETFGTMRDDELAQWRDHYAIRLATLDQDLVEDRPAMTRDELATYTPRWRAHLLSSGATRAVAAAELRASTRAFLRGLLAEATAEIARRERFRTVRTATAEVPQFPSDWLRDLKRRTNLDGLFEQEANLHLGRLSHAQQRSGPCPFCGGGEDSTRFRVYLADPDNERFHCFACGQSGDALTAIELLYNVDFRGACLILATHAGQPLPASMRPAAAPTPPNPNKYLDIARGDGVHE